MPRTRSKKKYSCGEESDPEESAKKVHLQDEIENLWDGRPWFDDDNDGAENPFLQDKILEVLMSQMTIKDLKMSRLVCQKWDNWSTLEFEHLTSTLRAQNFIIYSYDGDSIEFLSTSMENSPNKKLLASKIYIALENLSVQKPWFFENYQPQSLILNTSVWTNPRGQVERRFDKGDLLTQTKKILINSTTFLKSLRMEGEWRQSRKMNWPENLTFSQLEELIFEFKYPNDNLTQFYELLQNLLNNSPNMKILHLLNQPSDQPLYHILLDSGIIRNLTEFRIYWSFNSENHGYFVGPRDLLNMAESGLKLTKFSTSFIFEDFDENEILDHLQKFGKFLETQAGTLKVLKINLAFEKPNNNCKLLMPKLPSLKVLELKSVNGPFIPFTCMDLPTIFPKLREIIFILKSSDFWDLDQVFSGSLDSVETITIRYPKVNTFKNHSGYRELEKYFPKVRKLSLDRMGFVGQEQFEDIPWETTLRELTLINICWSLKLDNLAHLQELRRLNCNGNLDLNSLSKTKIRSFKLDKNFSISKIMINKIRDKYNFAFLPPSTLFHL